MRRYPMENKSHTKPVEPESRAFCYVCPLVIWNDRPEEWLVNYTSASGKDL
jgi:hypothetical protein